MKQDVEFRSGGALIRAWLFTPDHTPARRAGNKATVERYPIGHFGIYLGEHFERAVRSQTAFFKNHLFPA